MDDGHACNAGPDGTARVTVDLALDDPAWLEDVPGADACARRACIAALDHACPGPELGVSLVMSDDDRIRGLNRDWRHVDAATDVLSFSSENRSPGVPPRLPAGAPAGTRIELGDVVLARETLLRDARCEAKPARDHLSHLVVHGVLHLLGYDHETGADAEIMEGMERAVLAGLGIPDPRGRDAP